MGILNWFTRRPQPPAEPHAPLVIDPALAARLVAIGPYSEEMAEASRTYRWPRPAALAGAPLPFDLVWVMEADVESDAGAAAPGPDESMFALWDRYWPQHAEHTERFIAQIVAKYRSSTRQPEAPAQQALDLVEGADIVVSKIVYEDEIGYDLKAGVSAAWEVDHVFWFCYDENGGEFDDLEKV